MDHDLPGYGKLVNASGELIIATSWVYMRDVEYLVEQGLATKDLLAGTFDEPKASLEKFEGQLSRTKTHPALKNFHGCYTRGVRGTILRWGSLRRAGSGSAGLAYSAALEQFGRASQELSKAARKSPQVVEPLRLHGALMSLLFREIDWTELAVPDEVPTPIANAKSCSGCGGAVGETDRFCSECGAKVPRRCDSCGAPVSEQHKFCASCGHALKLD